MKKEKKYNRNIRVSVNLSHLEAANVKRCGNYVGQNSPEFIREAVANHCASILSVINFKRMDDEKESG